MRLRDHEPKIAVPKAGAPHDVALWSAEQHAEALRRRDIIVRLEQSSRIDATTVKAAAAEFGCSVSQLNRYRAAFRETELLSCLLPRVSTGGRGRYRLDSRVEAIIAAVREEFDRTKPNARTHHIIKEIRFRCRQAGLPEPSFNTLRSRLQAISLRERAKMKFGRKHARDRYEPALGETPPTSFPLERIQIDHTLCDVVCTGEFERGHIGRPWITVAIDEHTRAVLAFVLSWEYPNATTIALLLCRIMLPKEEWLRKLGLGHISWPMYGKPDAIYVDNANELNSKEVLLGCVENNIPKPLNRPGETPHWGGIIERFMGTAMDSLRLLRGSTADQKGFDRDKTMNPNETAEMSINELERWLVLEMAKYHLKPHEGNGNQRPDLTWERGIYGTEKRAGRGLPHVPDKQKIFIDFAPFERRHIGRKGVLWDYIHYWGESLRPFLANGDKRKFLFKRNPYDLDLIWFKDPDTGNYHELRTRRAIRSNAPLWEWQEHRRKLKERGDRIDQRAIDNLILEQRRIEGEASNNTSRWRRRQRDERRRGAAKLNAEVAKPAATSEPIEPEDVAETPRRRTKLVFEVED